MSSKLSKNWRSGHVNEALGVVLLRQIGAVATLASGDDHGIDAICTALKLRGGNLYPAASFYVQVKSESVDYIEFTDEDISWLQNLDLPYFVARVDLKNAKISLYTSINLARFFNYRSAVPVFAGLPLRLRFESAHEDDMAFKFVINNGRVHSITGAPVMKWTLDSPPSLGDDAVIHSWIAAARRSQRLCRVGVYEDFQWKTGGLPQRSILALSSRTHRAELWSEIAPLLHSVCSAAAADKDTELLKALMPVVLEAIKHGVDKNDFIFFAHDLMLATTDELAHGGGI